jgi:hypothetical protein
LFWTSFREFVTLRCLPNISKPSGNFKITTTTKNQKKYQNYGRIVLKASVDKKSSKVSVAEEIEQKRLFS